jgi:hypothetical protein
MIVAQTTSATLDDDEHTTLDDDEHTTLDDEHTTLDAEHLFDAMHPASRAEHVALATSTGRSMHCTQWASRRPSTVAEHHQFDAMHPVSCAEHVAFEPRARDARYTARSGRRGGRARLPSTSAS